MSIPNFKISLIDTIIVGDIDPSEANRLSHFAETGKLISESVATSTPSNRSVSLTELNKHQLANFDQIRSKAKPIFQESNFNDSTLKTSDKSSSDSSFESYYEFKFIPKPIMATFSLADFNRVIPEFKEDTAQLPIFLKRCDTFHNSIKDAGGKAFLIFESRKYET